AGFDRRDVAVLARPRVGAAAQDVEPCVELAGEPVACADLPAVRLEQIDRVVVLPGMGTEPVEVHARRAVVRASYIEVRALRAAEAIDAHLDVEAHRAVNRHRRGPARADGIAEQIRSAIPNPEG